MVFHVAAVVFLAWHPTTPHHMLSSHVGRYYARILSWRQFEYLPLGEILCRFRLSFESSDTRLSFFGFRFHVSFMHIAVA